jgi:hypothetical protein
MKISYVLAAYMLLTTVTTYGQESTMSATYFRNGIYLGEAPSIASRMANGTFIEAEDIEKEYNPKRSGANKVVPGKGLPKGGDPLAAESTPQFRLPSNPPIVTWNAASSSSTPTDPTGAIGPEHYMNSWNSSFRIWDREGNPLTNAASLANIWPGQTLGDPIIFYDRYAERFVITQFRQGPNGFLIGVCQGPDPINDGWFTYEFPSGSFPDYPKFSVWSDGYYITSNKNSGTAGTSEVVYALERDKMIVGDPSAQIVGFPLPGITTSGFFSPLGFNCSGPELPPPGNAPIIYMQDDVWFGVNVDHLKIWNINVNWTTPGSSTISTAQQLNTTPYDGLFDGGSFSNLPQPAGGDIDALQATIMYMAQYRRFPDYNVVVLNHVVDLDGGDDLAGIRWYELRQENDGDPWTIFQEGTYVQPDGHSAFSGSICMDSNGNIGLAYTVVSESIFPGLRYTGRFASDPPGQMTLAEESFGEGNQINPSTRYGDYSQMTIDPLDDKTFWHIGEYFSTGRKNRVGAFKIAADLAVDVGVIGVTTPNLGTFSNTEPITVVIRNFGLEAQSDIPVFYQVDGGAPVNEVFAGPIGPATTAEYTFTTTADLSVEGTVYSLYASTGLLTDLDPLNDDYSTEVTHIGAVDLGPTALTSPQSDPSLGLGETVAVEISNFGGADQSDFEISYSVNGGTPVVETVTDAVISQGVLEYTFTTPYDFVDGLGEYEFTFTVSQEGDSDNSNDVFSTIVEKLLCQPEQDCSFGDGIEILELGTINNNSGCDDGGYGNYTDLSTDLAEGTTHDMTVTTGYGDQHVRVWIDFNDNFNFTNSEIVISDFIIAAGQAGGTFTETMDLVIESGVAYGEHLMRVKTNWQATVPANECQATDFGETEDYTVNIGAVGLEENILGENDLILNYLSGNQFLMTFQSDVFNEPLIVTVHDIQGRNVIQNWVYPSSGVYQYDFDMSYAAKGAYLLRLGNDESGKVIRFVVQ